MPRQLTTTKTSHKEKKLRFFQSLSWLDYSNSLTLSNASEIFWNWISINHIQVQKRKKILSLLVYVLHETCEIRHFHVVVVQWRQRNICKKAWCTCKVVVLPCQAIAFFTFSSPLHLKLPIIYDTLWSVRNRIFSVQIELLLLIASETFFDSSVVPSFLVRKAWWTNRATVAR